MTGSAPPSAMARNVALYPWFKAALNLLFWQAVWFLYFQSRLSAADAILLYAIYDIGTIVIEVPSGYLSDRLGRKVTLVLACLAGLAGSAMLALGDGIAAFAAGQLLIGASAAFVSGTDSALLYESLAAAGREREVEAQELRAWRFSFTALAISALSGGALALWAGSLPFWAGLAAFAAALALCLRFTEPPHGRELPQTTELRRLGEMRRAFAEPVLRWLFALAMLMYVFSHVPFVFGQPFIFAALRRIGLAAEAPGVSGTATCAMMLISVATSLAAWRLRQRIGLPALLLLAFAMQIALCAAMAATGSVWAIGFLLLRMVPSALSRPFLLARIQPLLGNAMRVTYLSLQSFCGRLILAASLFLAAGSATGAGEMPYGEIRMVLAAYSAAGLLSLVLLWSLARGQAIEPAAA